MSRGRAAAGRPRRGGEVSGQLSLLGECLDARDRAVLAFARAHHLQGRATAARVQAELEMSEVRYLQRLVRLLDRVEAADAEPELITALRAVRDRGRGRRGVALAAGEPRAPG